MAQQREKDETLDLKVPADAPLACKITRPDPLRPDPLLSKPKSDAPEPSKPQDRTRTGDAAPSPAPPAASSQSRRSGGSDPKKSVNRCSGCGKRVGLTEFRCRCGELFCPEHRYSDRHDCSYDYKAAGREAIARENPVVRAAKILKV